VHDLVIAGGHRDYACQQAFVYKALHGLGDSVQAGGIHAYFFG